MLLDRTSSGDSQRSQSHRCLIKPWRASCSVSMRDATLAASLDVGLLVERGASLDLHPLARVFLEDRAAQLDLAPSDAAARYVS